ncbi:oxygen-evolving enhancer protein [Scenedesmus sp. NREL 46B-D3]|nr:oxygen-evolving enhancer protein [Scenedesmus sp. NREL 46B-D3]
MALATAIQLGLMAPDALATRDALSYDDLQSLTYLEVKGSGLANRCPIIPPPPTGDKGLSAGSYEVTQFCMEPDAFFVREEGKKDFDPSKVLTRQTYTLDMMTGKIDVGSSGLTKLALNKDGIDFAAVGVVPLLFTARNLSAEAAAGGVLRGMYDVPSYRGATFMDPKKQTPGRKGVAELQVDTVDSATKEMSGSFRMLQPSDDDLGSKESADIAVVGKWYARIA